MVRDFNDVDKNKKKERIRLPENPGNLAPDKLAELEEKVKASLKGGYLPCAKAFKIAEELNVPKVAVGAMTDKLGLRVSDCRTGCFKVEKTIRDGAGKKIDEKIMQAVEELKNKDELTCANVYAVAERFGVLPMTVADAANLNGWKIRQCQLGCF